MVVAIESNTYEPGGDTPEDVAYAPYVELWVQLPEEDAAACDESRARVYSVQSGAPGVSLSIAVRRTTQATCGR